ncbi:MAG TPA: chorismate-binding protein, partial [Puia sp.]|nr:chorismate-binding protein [Puia sp.]
MAKRQFVSFPFSDLYNIKQQVLNWSARFNTFSFLDNQLYTSPENNYECLVAAGERARLKTDAGGAFKKLKAFSLEHEDWLFGHFSFDLKSETENVPSTLPDQILFPDLFFFVPEIVLLIFQGEIQIGLFGDHHQIIWEEIKSATVDKKPDISGPVIVRNRMSKHEYLHVIEKLRQHILRGDCYEINYCQEFFAEAANPDPLELFRALTDISPSPFSAYYSADDLFLLCASPERFLKRRGDNILSQPIK